ncbi:MAG: HU family DNA-binding protein [Pseudomonadota bacterium]
MTRTELIELLSVKLPNLSLPMVEQLVKEVFDYISEAMAAGNRVELRDFGVFFTVVREAHEARNPKTGAKVVTEPHALPRFRAGKELKEQVNAALLTAEPKTIT